MAFTNWRENKMAQDRVEAVERALTLLDCFTEEAQEITLGDLAGKTGFYRSTILRLSHSLERFGYLSRRPNGSYRLGPTLRRLGSLYGPLPDLKDYVLPVMRRLRDRTEESVSFYVRDGDARVCLFRANSTRPVHYHISEGARLPLHVGAAGRVLLAFAGEPGPSYNETRESGYAVSLGERHSEAASVAVPVFSAHRILVGALGISGPLPRFTSEAQHLYVTLLKEATADLASIPDPIEGVSDRSKGRGRKKKS